MTPGCLMASTALLQAEQLGVLVDLALEVGDEEDGGHTEHGDDHGQEDEHDLHALGDIGDGGDDAGVDEADDQSGHAVDGVADADLRGVLVLLAAQADHLEAGAPPHEDGGDAHGYEQHEADLHRRQHGVDAHEHRRGEEAHGGQRAHAELVGHDTGGQIADHGRDAVGRHHKPQIGVRAAERLHQRIVEHILKVHGRVDDGRAHGDEHDECPLVKRREILVRHFPFALCKQRHGKASFLSDSARPSRRTACPARDNSAQSIDLECILPLEGRHAIARERGKGGYAFSCEVTIPVERA